MPNAATLESLTIEVNGSASNASASIKDMIAPLRSLARGIGTVIPALRSLNKELKELSKYGKISLPEVKVGGGKSATTSGKKASAGTKPTYEQIMNAWVGKKDPTTGIWTYTNSLTGKSYSIAQAGIGKRPEPITNATPTPVASKSREQILAERREITKAIQEEQDREAAKIKFILPQDLHKNETSEIEKAADSATASVKKVGEVLKGTTTASTGATTALKNVDKELRQKNTDGKKAKEGLNSAANGIRNVGKAAEGSKKNTSGFGKALSTIGRMAKSLLIRTALRSMMKAFSESWTAAYAFSQHMGGSFAKSIDTVRGAFTSVSFSVIQTFAPVLEAIVPIVVTVANAINYLCSVIQSLFSLLGMTSDLLGASASQMDKFRKSSGGGSGKKGQLAKFDELNVIQTSSGGGGGGGASGLGMFEAVSKEIDAITAILVGEALMAVGLILAFTGHIPLGVALIAVGAASVAKTVINDWGKLTEDVKGEIATIMLYASGAFLGLGLILAFTGHIPLGVALMALGAANLAGTVYLGNTNQIPDTIKEKLTNIMVIAGASLLAIGAILAFTGVAIPLGIGMMAVGGVALAGAAAMNWDSLSGKIKSVFKGVCDFLKKAWDAVEKAVTDAWNSVKQWWEDSGIGAKVRGVWTTVRTWFVNAWNAICNTVTDAWNAVAQWWNNGGVKNLITNVWTSVRTWLVNAWNAISNTVSDAWNAVAQWWENSGLKGLVSSAWSGVRTWLVNTWNGIENGVTDAWNAVTNWWTTNVTKNVEKEGVWGGVKGFFEGVFGENGIGGWVTSAWNSVKQFWEENFADKIKGMWDGLTQFFTDLFKPLQDAANWVAEILGIDGKNISATVNINQTTNGKTTPSAGNTNSQVVGYTLSKAKYDSSKKLSGISSVVNDVSKTVQKNLFNGWNLVTGRASGGFVPAGDLFIANEQGAELIGSMNGKTAVANQGQIIEGIQRGVYSANSEQNALLREQNSLLQQILEKETNVRLGASSALGRIVTQSQQMYAKQVGG